MRAIILSIGDELVLGQTVDTNAAWLSERLARVGIDTRYHQTLADDRAAIADAIRVAAGQAAVVIATGGIGPTEDDLTRHGLADAMEAPLVTDPNSVEAIEMFFAERGRPMPQRNKIQAMHPDGSTMIPNARGTAPGIHAALDQADIYITPGVPGEMKAMYEASIEPELLPSNTQHGVILTAAIHTFGAGESDVAQMIADLTDRDRNPTVGTTVAGGIVSVRIRSAFDDPRKAEDELQRTIREVEQLLHPIAFGRDDDTLQAIVIALLKEANQTIATAESCTGGMVGATLTDVPGSSAVYAGGWITYSNDMKRRELAVPIELLDQHGAVSEPVVRAMAQGARERSGTNFAVAITGIAGPDGGAADKPVGTVWVALADQHDTRPLRLHLPGPRHAVRDRSAKAALQLIRLRLLDESPDHIRWARPAADSPGASEDKDATHE